MENNFSGKLLAEETRDDIKRLEGKVERLEKTITKVEIWGAILLLILHAIASYFRIEILNQVSKLLP